MNKDIGRKTKQKSRHKIYQEEKVKKGEYVIIKETNNRELKILKFKNNINKVAEEISDANLFIKNTKEIMDNKIKTKNRTFFYI